MSGAAAMVTCSCRLKPFAVCSTTSAHAPEVAARNAAAAKRNLISCSFCIFAVVLEDAGPAVRAIDGGARGFGAVAHALDVTVLELDNS